MVSMTNWIPVEIPAADLEAFLRARPTGERGFLAGPLPECPRCFVPATGINIVGEQDVLAYVTIQPCSHMLIAMHTLASGGRFG